MRVLHIAATLCIAATPAPAKPLTIVDVETLLNIALPDASVQIPIRRDDCQPKAATAATPPSYVCLYRLTPDIMMSVATPYATAPIEHVSLACRLYGGTNQTDACLAVYRAAIHAFLPTAPNPTAIVAMMLANAAGAGKPFVATIADIELMISAGPIEGSTVLTIEPTAR